MERGPRQQITFLEEEGVSKERKALRKNKTRQDKTGVCTSFWGKGDSPLQQKVCCIPFISAGICWSLYKGDTTISRQLPQAQPLPSSVQPECWLSPANTNYVEQLSSRTSSPGHIWLVELAQNTGVITGVIAHWSSNCTCYDGQALWFVTWSILNSLQKDRDHF